MFVVIVAEKIDHSLIFSLLGAKLGDGDDEGPDYLLVSHGSDAGTELGGLR
jgi:hypothetical protein